MKPIIKAWLHENRDWRERGYMANLRELHDLVNRFEHCILREMNPSQFVNALMKDKQKLTLAHTKSFLIVKGEKDGWVGSKELMYLINRVWKRCRILKKESKE